jgi:Zn-finger nucleic acid-binding protein
MSHSTAAAPRAATSRAWDTTSALRPPKPVCPDCHRRSDQPPALELCRVDGVDFHRCRVCGGTWFYEKDLELALSATGARTWPAPGTVPAARDGAAWVCPCCGGALVQVRDRHREGVAVRRCLVCYGSWLEHAALQRAAALSSDWFARIRRTFRRLWPR